jgi:putative transposase
MKGRTNEASKVHRRADYRRAEGAGSGREDCRSGSSPRRVEATIYNCKAKYGGLEVSEAKRLRALEDENAKLKRLLAETMLDNAGLKDFLAKNW